MSEEKKSFLDSERWREASKAFQEAIAEDEQRQEEYWQSLTPDQQLDAFCCVARRIHRGDVQERGSYRYVLYDVFGWGPEAYVPAQCAGYLDIHNLIYSGLEHDAGPEIAAEVALIDELLIVRQTGNDDERTNH